MCRLIWGFAGHTYHIVGNLMSRLNYISQWNGSFEHPKQTFKLMDKKIFLILPTKFYDNQRYYFIFILQARRALGDFGMFIAIIMMVLFDHFLADTFTYYYIYFTGSKSTWWLWNVYSYNNDGAIWSFSSRYFHLLLYLFYRLEEHLVTLECL